MKIRFAFPLAVFLMLLTVALCTGSQLFLLLSVLVLLVFAFAFFGVVWASSTLEADTDLAGGTVTRGEDLMLNLRMRHRGLLPVAPLLLELSDPAGKADREIRLKNMPRRIQSLRLPVHTSHVGVFSVGLRAVTVEDLLGLVRRRIVMENTVARLTVLPQTFQDRKSVV